MPVGENRIHRIVVRVTPAEKLLLEQAALLDEISLADWMREQTIPRAETILKVTLGVRDRTKRYKRLKLTPPSFS